MTNLLLDLFDHMQSADAAVWSAALKSPSAAGDAQLCKYLLHASSVQRAFLDAWKGRPFTFRDNFDAVHLDDELVAVRAYYPEARAFITDLDADALGGTMRLPWVGWIEQQSKQTLAPTTLCETILQVISHSTHHRAQANTRLRMVGAEPPMVDYIAWLWRGRPKPEWPSITKVQSPKSKVQSSP